MRVGAVTVVVAAAISWLTVRRPTEPAEPCATTAWHCAASGPPAVVDQLSDAA
jgi:hypothetical protein